MKSHLSESELATLRKNQRILWKQETKRLRRDYKILLKTTRTPNISQNTNKMKWGSPEFLSNRSKLSTGENNGMWGKKHSVNTIIKIADKKKIENLSHITRVRLIESKVGGVWYGNVKYYDGPQYCEKWTQELRERVRAYFGYCCVECGEKQNGKKLSVHHVHYNKRACCNETPRTLVPLCSSCHLKTNYNRDYWSDHFQEIVDNYYDGRCWLTKEEFAAYKK